MSSESDPPLRKLRATLTGIRRRFFDDDGRVCDYKAIRSSGGLDALGRAGADLADIDLPSDRNAALTAWLNIHNALLITSVLEAGVEKSVREDSKFDRRHTCMVGGHEYSLTDIRYGVLGENRRPPYALRRPFNQKDPRHAHVVHPIDPRVRLALLDGTRSGPPFAVYEADKLDDQLTQTAKIFINHLGGVAGCAGAGLVGLSPIFMWHAKEFGGPGAVRHFLAGQIEDPDLAHQLRTADFKLKVLEYDWGLNQRPPRAG